MPAAVESRKSVQERVAELERQFAELRSEVLNLKPRRKNWRHTVGMMPDDKYSRGAVKLGQKWRKQANES